ncbi:MAG: class II fumarate hydratase [Thermoprotei archaeon]
MKYVEASKNVFMETGTRFHPEVVWALALIKRSAADVNVKLSQLEPQVGEAIIKVADEILEGTHMDRVVVDVFQTGSGTGVNMNVNELIAELATASSGLKIHPNDHVNMGQSSNDVVPSAIRVAAVKRVEERLVPALNTLIASLSEASRKWAKVYKAGRTHLRDALPVTLGQELGAYADAFKNDLAQIVRAEEYVKELPIGGTAVGTGLNAHPSYAQLVVEAINNRLGYGFRPASDRFRAMRLLTDLVHLSSGLKVAAIDLYRLCQDIRLMFSGPITGLGEVDIPTQEEVAGSSIMPGKTNPVTVEAAMLVAAQTVGLDQANQFASMLGEFELAMGVPLLGHNICTQVDLLAGAYTKIAKLVVDHLEPNIERLKRYAESSPALITVISPVIGYDKASQLGKKLATGLSIRDALRELGMGDTEIDRVLDLENLVKPGVPSKSKQ